MKIEPVFVRIPDACEVLDVSRSTLYRMIAAGEIPTRKVGRLTRIPVSALREYAGGETVGDPDA